MFVSHFTYWLIILINNRFIRGLYVLPQWRSLSLFALYCCAQPEELQPGTAPGAETLKGGLTSWHSAGTDFGEVSRICLGFKLRVQMCVCPLFLPPLGSRWHRKWKQESDARWDRLRGEYCVFYPPIKRTKSHMCYWILWVMAHPCLSLRWWFIIVLLWLTFITLKPVLDALRNGGCVSITPKRSSCFGILLSVLVLAHHCVCLDCKVLQVSSCKMINRPFFLLWFCMLRCSHNHHDHWEVFPVCSQYLSKVVQWIRVMVHWCTWGAKVAWPIAHGAVHL